MDFFMDKVAKMILEALDPSWRLPASEYSGAARGLGAVQVSVSGLKHPRLET